MMFSVVRLVYSFCGDVFYESLNECMMMLLLMSVMLMLVFDEDVDVL